MNSAAFNDMIHKERRKKKKKKEKKGRDITWQNTESSDLPIPSTSLLFSFNRQ